MNLDLPREQFEALLQEASQMVLRLYDGLEDKPVFQKIAPSELRKSLTTPMPEEPGDAFALLREVEEKVFPHATLNISPNFYAYVMSGSNPVGILADLFCSALNQNCGKWHIAASAAEIELLVIRWLAEMIGFPSDTAGVLVSGGSGANLVALAAARKAKAPFDVSRDGVKAGPPMTLYTSTEGHSCLEKSADLLGFGKKQLRKIPVLDDYTIDVGRLEEQIRADRAQGFHPLCVIANGGTVNTGAVDPLEIIAEVCKRNDLWFHIDGAYGCPAAATAIAGGMFRGLELADSLALDAHKWLSVPFEAGCTLVRDRSALRDAFSLVPEYLKQETDAADRFDASEYTYQLSRSFRALKIWMTMKTYGTKKLVGMIQENIETMRYLGELVDQSGDFERVADVPLSIVCFRYRTTDSRYHGNEGYLATLQRQLLKEIESDGRVFLTGTVLRGQPVLRACGINHRTEKRHVEYLLKVLRELGQRTHSSLCS